MIISSNEKLLVLRFNEFGGYDFIEEHKKIIETKGQVWMLKLGAKVPSRNLDEILSGSKGLILKSPKANGGKYYYCRMVDAKNTTPNKGMAFPDYYKALMEKLYWFSSDGTWICVDSIYTIDAESSLKLRLASNDRLLDEVLSQTRTTILYGYATEDISIDTV